MELQKEAQWEGTSKTFPTQGETASTGLGCPQGGSGAQTPDPLSEVLR